MDLLSRLITFVEDLRELPTYRRVGAVFSRARRGGLAPFGLRIRQQAERMPDRVLLRFEDATVSYGAYNTGVNRYVRLLRRAGVARGEPVAIVMENSPDFLMAQGAMAKTGAIGALVNSNLAGAALEHALRAAGARLVLADAACAGPLAELPSRRRWLVYARGEAGFHSLEEALGGAEPEEPDLAEVTLGDVFLYVYTSGTTGLPKPAIVRHARFTLGGESLRVLLDIGAEDCTYAPTPLYHGYANFVGFAPAFHAGAAFASRRRFSARHFLDDARRHGVTHFLYVGELCRYLLRQPPSPADRDHRIRLASGPGLRPEIWREFQERFGIARIVETYGQTEGNVSLMNRRGRVGSVGRAAPFQHRRLRLVRFDPQSERPWRGPDGFLREVGPGEVGELLGEISPRNPMSFDGYANPADNEPKVLRDCFRRGDAWLRTGDLMRRDRASYYDFVDRVGDTFRWKGENVATMEVASILNRLPWVAESAVYGVRVPGTEGRAGMAAIVLGPGAVFDPASFHAHVSRHLPRYARPLFVRLVAAIDTTGTLKHVKRRLQEEGYDPQRVGDPLFFLDAHRGTYVPLDAEWKRRIDSGQVAL